MAKKKRRSRKKRNRKLVHETLEQRQLLAGDMLASWQNAANPMDVNNDEVVSPLDALALATEWGRTGPGPLDTSTADAGLPMMYVDVDGDGALTEQDFDALVAYLDNPRQPSHAMGYVGGEGEGSGSGSCSAGPPSVTVDVPDPNPVLEMQPVTISGTASENVGHVDLDLGWGYSATGIPVQGDGTWSAEVVYLDDVPVGTSVDTATITATATDWCGQTATASTTVDVINEPPTLAPLVLSSSEIDEGQTVDLGLYVEDAAYYEDVLTATVNWGDGIEQTFDVAVFMPFPLSHTYVDDPSDDPNDEYTITVTVEDDDGGSVTDDATVRVNNVAPTITLNPVDGSGSGSGGGSSSGSGSGSGGGSPSNVLDEINEGDTFTITGDIYDPGANDTLTMTLEMDLNFDSDTEDSGETVELSVANNTCFMYTAPDPVADDGAWYHSTSGERIWGNESESDTLTVVATVADDDGDTSDEVSGDVIVHNVPPNFDLLAEGQPKVTLEYGGASGGLTATVGGGLVDAGSGDLHRISIAWGDGGVGDGVNNPIEFEAGVTEFDVARTLLAGEIATVQSLFPIIVEVRDDDSVVSDSYVIQRAYDVDIDIALAYEDEFSMDDSNLVEITEDETAIFAENQIPFRVHVVLGGDALDAHQVRVTSSSSPSSSPIVQHHGWIAPGEETYIDVAVDPDGDLSSVTVNAYVFDGAADPFVGDPPVAEEATTETLTALDIRVNTWTGNLELKRQDVKDWSQAGVNALTNAVFEDLFTEEAIDAMATEYATLHPEESVDVYTQRINEYKDVAKQYFADSMNPVVEASVDRIFKPDRPVYRLKLAVGNEHKPGIEAVANGLPAALNRGILAKIAEAGGSIVDHIDEFVTVEWAGVGDVFEHATKEEYRDEFRDFLCTGDRDKLSDAAWRTMPIVKKITLSVPFDFDVGAAGMDGSLAVFAKDISVSRTDKIGVEATLKLTNPVSFSINGVSLTVPEFELKGSESFNPGTEEIEWDAEGRLKVTW